MSRLDISRQFNDLGDFDLPDGLIFRNRVKPRRGKYSAFNFQKFMIIVTVSRLDKRGERVVTIVGRDAMDATSCASTRRCELRTTKACRPGALVAGAKLALR